MNLYPQASLIAIICIPALVKELYHIAVAMVVLLRQKTGSAYLKWASLC